MSERSASSATARGAPTLRFLGHAAFSITWRGLRICLDPHKPGALGGRFTLPPIDGPFDHVVVSHVHEDHCAWTSALGSAQWHDGDGDVGPLRLRTRPVFHDAVSGTRMGLVRMVSLDDGALRIVHAGDIGAWDEDDVAWLAGTDVLLVPAGGTYTLDGAEAAAFAQAVRPRFVVPMHAADPRVDLALEPLDRFFEAFDGPVARVEEPAWRLPARPVGGAGEIAAALTTSALVLAAP